jgi:hypothetical protein
MTTSYSTSIPLSPGSTYLFGLLNDIDTSFLQLQEQPQVFVETPILTMTTEPVVESIEGTNSALPVNMKPNPNPNPNPKPKPKPKPSLFIPRVQERERGIRNGNNSGTNSQQSQPQQSQSQPNVLVTTKDGFVPSDEIFNYPFLIRVTVN